MASPRKAEQESPMLSKHDHSILVLQGGGALGAYQAGVYEGMAELKFAPDWVTGVSIGAINAALIAGNPPGLRVERLREFWDLVSSGNLVVPPSLFDPLRGTINRLSASATATFGVPGFFQPRFPPSYLMPEGDAAAMSIYDTSPLRDTLVKLIDFDVINDKDAAKSVRLSMGAVNVHTGNSTYFDNRKQWIGPEHIMASGALPPGFPAVVIDGDHYWDGGIVSNSPLWYVLDDSPRINALIAQVDLFSARGDLPTSLDEVLERVKDIQFSSKTRFNTNRVKELEAMRAALGRLLKKLPPKLRDDADVVALRPLAEFKRSVTLMHLINRRLSHSSSAKDYEFSRATVRELWNTGLEDVRRSCAKTNWRKIAESDEGIQILDLAD
jgi:NTE family protein